MGKVADLVVLDQDLMAIPDEELPSLTPVMTLLRQSDPRPTRPHFPAWSGLVGVRTGCFPLRTLTFRAARLARHNVASPRMGRDACLEISRLDILHLPFGRQ